MVDSSSGLWMSELRESWITFLEHACAPWLLVLLLPLGLTVTLVHVPRFAALCLFDILQIAVAEEGEHAQESNQISIAIVVDTVRLVPVGEDTHVSVGDWGLVTWLEFTRDAN